MNKYFVTLLRPLSRYLNPMTSLKTGEFQKNEIHRESKCKVTDFAVAYQQKLSKDDYMVLRSTST